MIRGVSLLLAPALLAAADLGSLSWLAGRWAADDAKAVSEEIWSPPSGDGMIGMWRLVAGGQARVLEFMTIRQEGDGVVLLLRHFDPALAVRANEKDGPIRLKLQAGNGNPWTFEGNEGGSPVRLIYSRPDGQTLQVILDKGGKQSVFRMRRVD